MAMLSRREFAASAFALAAPIRLPNVIVCVMDDLGCHDLGYLGASDLETPNIDAWAGAGARCPNWYSNAPVCAPSRSAILSGRFPANAGVPVNGRELTPGLPTVASVLNQAGYRTAAIGKWHLGSSENTRPNARGFDSFYGFHSGCIDFYSQRYYWGEPRIPNYHDLWRNRTEIFDGGHYITERITEEAVQFIGENHARPFFIYLAYNAPHYPMHAPEKYKARFARLPFERRVYAAMIAAVDDGLGAVRKELERHGLFENTLFFLVGDNGATTEKRAGLNNEYATAGDNGPYRGFKFSLFDGGTHVPGFITWPAGIPRGTLVKETVMSMDILPTICRATGLRAPAGLDGKDVLDVLASGARSPHVALLWRQNGQLAVRRGRWKLVVNGRVYDRRPEGNKPLTGDDALFLSDLDSDPGETKNLRRVHPNIADELATLVQRWSDTLATPE